MSVQEHLAPLVASSPLDVGAATHEVVNQPPPLVDYNVFTTDHPLVEALRREGAAWAEDDLRAFGGVVGSAEVLALGPLANDNPPILRTHDRYGNRADVVDFHPAWHALLRMSIGAGLHASPWSTPRAGAHVARAAKVIVMSQAEGGHQCPVTMTYGVVPVLRRQPEIAAEWEPKITSTTYDERHLPMPQKKGVLLGMGMTEKQGGSDVRANTTRAVPEGEGGPGREYRLTGHKWFFSAPMCDAFLVLAQAPRGISCFFVPRFTPDGTKNALHLQRLKTKLGNRSNASSEVELHGAWGRLVGEEGRGVPTIIEMANHTRLDCMTGSTALMRQALTQAVHHCTFRRAFGKALIEQPLMRNVLADLAIEAEAATALSMRVARAYDAQGDAARAEVEGPFRRIATAIGKYWICKRAPAVAVEALETLGGNGYVEESGMPRLYREAPLNSIWEGSGNVICLDVLRAMVREPRSADALLAEVREARGGDRRLDAWIDALDKELAPGLDDRQGIEARARRVVERMALALQGALLVRFAPHAVADAFCASRLAGDWGYAFGTLPASVDVGAILARAAVD